MIISFPFLIGLAHLALATPLGRRWDDLAEKHAWVEIPHGWEYEAPAPKDYEFNLRIALKQDKIDDLISNLLEISEPTHPRYGQHLTQAESEAFTAPHPDSIEAVDSWLRYHGISPEDIVRQTAGGEWVTVRLSVTRAEHMLGTKYNVYRHSASSQKVVRSLSYSLPRELHAHIGVVMPTTYFGTIHSMRATHLKPQVVPADAAGASPSSKPASCSTTITLSCLESLYHTAGYTVSGTNNNTLGIAGYLNEYANFADRQTFYHKYQVQSVGSSFAVTLVNGGLNDQSNPGVEANLDVQYGAGIAWPTPAIYYSTGGSPPFIPDDATPTNTNEPYVDWLNYVLGQTTTPQVITTSYGDDEQTVPLDYATTVCNLFATLGSRGTTVLFSSGDAGVGAGSCRTNDGTNKVIFQPVFPASCPFVTSVGATHRINPEIVASFSGGGFSRYFTQPSYQSSAVSSFLTGLGNTYAGLYNPSGRAYPDISAQGVNYLVVVGGRTLGVSGTSCSSPAAAAVFSLLNDFHLSRGGTSLGFINPLLYSTAASAFNDVTSGSNPGCGTNGFSAGAGWDPVTGLGTPDFTRLQSFV